MIYIENSQNLFTYNCYSDDQFNRIEDSIITVYTGNVDHSFLARETFRKKYHFTGS